MRGLGKIIAVIFLVVAVLPILLFAGYDLTEFQSRRSDIASLISGASADERNPSLATISLVRNSLGGKTSAFAARLLLDKLHIPWVTKGMFGWHATSALWWACVAIHLSEQEQVTIIASHSYMGNARYGFSTESTARFNKPLSSLSTAEIATVVALTKAPSLYASSPERLAQRRDWLLSTLSNGS